MSLFRPKSRVNPELVHLVDQHNEIMAEHLGERFVDLSRVALAPQRVAKLPLNHAERALDVRPLVVVGEEVLAPVEEVAERFGPRATPPATGPVCALARA